MTLLNSLLVLLNDSSLLMGFQFENVHGGPAQSVRIWLCVLWCGSVPTERAKTVTPQSANGQEELRTIFPLQNR